MKGLFIAVLALVVAAPSFAAVKAPKDTSGAVLPTIDFVGADTCRVDNSTGTNAIVCASGSGLVIGVSFTAAYSSSTLVLRDSATANTSSTPLWTALAETDREDEGTAVTLMHKLPAPIKFANGLTVNSSAALGTGAEVIVIYRKHAATE